MKIRVAASFNQKYVKYALVMLYSLFENQCEEDEVTVYILESSISADGKKSLEELAQKYHAEIIFLHVDETIFPKELKTNDVWSIEIYYRLLLQELLPDVETVIYLDADVIVNKSIRSLMELDWTGKMVYAARDMSKFPFGDVRDTFLETAFQNGHTYFCSGVMVFHLGKIREWISFQDYLALAKKWQYQMIAPDQDLLNGMFAGTVGYLDEQYSVFPRIKGYTYEDMKENAYLIHYVGNKPWQGQYIHSNVEQLWWDYAKQLPLYPVFLEEFVHESINDNMMYETLQKCSEEKDALYQELLQIKEMIYKLFPQ